MLHTVDHRKLISDRLQPNQFQLECAIDFQNGKQKLLSYLPPESVSLAHSQTNVLSLLGHFWVALSQFWASILRKSLRSLHDRSARGAGDSMLQTLLSLLWPIGSFGRIDPMDLRKSKPNPLISVSLDTSKLYSGFLRPPTMLMSALLHLSALDFARATVIHSTKWMLKWIRYYFVRT